MVARLTGAMREQIQMEVFDYIIVGGGSAGCVLAERLSAHPQNSVLLIEAGPSDRNPFLHMPRGIGLILMPGNEHVYTYNARKGRNQGDDMWLKGRALGGSSSVNGMVYVRGHPSEFDDWEAAGCHGWGWRDIGRCFKAIEGHVLGEDEFRGAAGPLKISIHDRPTPLSESILTAGGEAGLPRLLDPNNAPPEGGIGYLTRTISGGRRMSAARAFLKPALNRPNLTVLTDTQVRKVQFDERRAASVLVESKGTGYEIGARNDIILCAGAAETPKLLELSGIGAASRLSAFGIPVVADLPEVGENLREHLNAPLKFALDRGAFNREFRGLRLPFNALRYFLNRSGPLTHAAQELVAFGKSRPEYDRYDIQLGFTLLSWARKDGKTVVDSGDSVTVHNYYGRPDSRGSSHIVSADPDKPPAIDANYLASPEDRRHSVDGVRLARKLMTQPALASFNPRYDGPAVNFDSDENILEFLQDTGRAAFHIAGTCRMGSDAGSVVDPQLRVRGVDGLRVIDTSVMPTLLTGNLNGPTMAMAWRAAELILERP